MTGIYVRVEREGRWQSVEFDQLTDEEMRAFARDSTRNGWEWAISLAQWIRDNVKEKEEDAIHR
jgi:hypothetical protein